jgi:alcohol dehydrogenase
MHALVYDGPGKRTWRDVPDARVEADTDAVVRVDAVTICGTDLHILRGDVPEVAPGTVLGHEAVGTVVAIGAGVRRLRIGDRVLVSCITACATCAPCRAGRYGQCQGGGGWILGHTIHGVQAEYARVPFADTSTFPVPEGVEDDEVLMLADILPTSYEVGVRNGEVMPGDSVAVIGAGPIGLAAVITAQLFSPGLLIVVDPAASRLEAAKALGADVLLNPDYEDVPERVAELTYGAGVDVAVEAVGIPKTFELCTELVRAGGRVANVGVHGRSATLHLETLWIKDVTIRTGLVDTWSTPTLLGLLQKQKIAIAALVTHRFELSEMEHAYDVFERPVDTGALKVVLFGGAPEGGVS